MNDSLIREGERLDDLQREGLRLIQNPSWFCFGMDAVLLSAFTCVEDGQTCLDLGCGNGVIPILLAGRTAGKYFAGLEIQEEIAEMASRSVRYNHLEERVNIVTGDIKEATSNFEAASFDVITSNPPYMSQNRGLTNDMSYRAIARHELKCTLEDVVAAAEKLLKPGGHFFMVHRPFRLADIICCMRQYHLEPKRMRFVYPFVDKKPNMILIEGVRGGNPQITVEPPLIVYEKENVYTEEVKDLYYN